MEKLAKKLAIYTIKQGNISKEEYEVYKYGFQTALEMIVCMVVSMFIIIHMNMISEGLIFFMVFILLRSYAGGLHLQHYYSCFLCSNLVLVCAMMLVKKIVLPVSILWLIIGGTILGIKILGPVENINRQLVHKEKRYFKKKLRIVLLCIAICSVGLGIFNVSKYLTVIAFTMIIVVLSMILGKVKFQKDYCSLTEKDVNRL